jgi:hypothetical protein
VTDPITPETLGFLERAACDMAAHPGDLIRALDRAIAELGRDRVLQPDGRPTSEGWDEITVHRLVDRNSACGGTCEAHRFFCDLDVPHSGDHVCHRADCR